MFDIPSAIEAGSNLITGVLDRLWPNPDKEEQRKLDLAKIELNNELSVIMGQLAINKAEAENPNFWIAGARPAFLWLAVSSMFYNGIFISLLNWVCLIFGLPAIPPIPPAMSDTLLYGLLGVGGYRTVEKINKVDTKRIGK